MALICLFMLQIHFSLEMWEKPRVDGKRILKHNAMPTIFKPISETVIASRQNNEVMQSVCQTVKMSDKSNLVNDEIATQIHEEPTESITNVVTKNQPIFSSSQLDCEIYWKKRYAELNYLFIKREKTYDGVVKKCNRLHNILKKKVKRLTAEKISLHKQYVKNTRLYSIIKKVFTDDQIRVLINRSTRGSKWSEETIKRAVKLRSACGLNGYKELLQQQISLPSVRTLQQNSKYSTLNRRLAKKF